MADEAVVERPGAQDLLQLAVDVGPAPMQVGVAVVLDRPLDVDDVVRALDERVPGAPRLRRRLVATPPGCGRPVWLDDPAYDVRRHVREVACPVPGDEAALLAVLADAVTTRLEPARPLWAARLVTGLAGGGCALVVVVHHLLADGLAGLAVLSQLLDGAPSGPRDAGFPRPAPSRRQLVADAWTARWAATRRVPAGLREIRAGFRELGGGRPARTPATSLNRPTGPHRRLGVARAPLGRVVAAARGSGGTVNDVLLCAVAGALGRLARMRGEALGSVVASVPVSARAVAAVGEQGNATGAMPVRVPLLSSPAARLPATVAATRAAKGARRGTSAAVLIPAFQVLARLGAFRWFVDHQRLVTTFVSNVRGPGAPVTFLGARVVGLVPVAVVPGNVTVAFTALSYAGELVVTVVADPDQVPELDLVVGALQEELDTLATAPDPR